MFYMMCIIKLLFSNNVKFDTTCPFNQSQVSSGDEGHGVMTFDLINPLDSSVPVMTTILSVC